jgi:CheY-like chemotaxis protein
MMRLTVEDSGVGIKPDIQEKIFDPFFKMHHEDHMPGDSDPVGTGMGLTICKRLAVAMNGNLTVGSVPHEGSTFCLTFRSRADRPVAALPTSNKDDSGEYELNNIDLTGNRILFVDDQYDMQQMIQKYLSQVGAKVDLADNGRVGMEMALASGKAGRPYDLVLMDIEMPVMNGITAVEKLRNNGYKQPIVMLTAYASADNKERSSKAGCNAMLTKPVNRDMLLKMMQKFLTRQTVVQSTLTVSQ